MSEKLHEEALAERNKRERRIDFSRPNLTTSGDIGHNRGPPLDNVPRYVDVKGAAEILHVSASFLNKLRMTGDGPPFAKFGFHVRYNVPGLLAWAASRVRTSTSDNGGQGRLK
jgi:hypothetical protein